VTCPACGEEMTLQELGCATYSGAPPATAYVCACGMWLSTPTSVPVTAVTRLT
jgi:hypothetical protein